MSLASYTMVCRTLCFVLILQHIPWTLAAKLHYAVIFPSEIISHHSENICIHLEGAQGESRVQISLQLNKNNTTLIDRTFQPDPVFKCLKLQVPDPKEIEEVGTLEVSVQNAGKTITKSRKVLVKKKRSIVLVQTDKAVYKPGQTVRFRILSLDEDLKPKNILLPAVELQDPEKNRIGQWLDVSLKQGIAELSLSLTSEPQLGEYTIKVKDTVHTFTVEKYVLPKFEVILQFPKYVMFNCESFTIKICGRYTYGKPVQGDYQASVCQNPYSYALKMTVDAVSDICVNFAGKLDKSGCHIIEVKSEAFKMRMNYMERKLKVVAFITDEATGIKLSALSETSISALMTKVSFVDADTNYKPGLPYSGVIKVEDVGDNPVSGTKVYLQSKFGPINQTLLTNEKGQASFTLNTTDWKGTVFLRVKTSLENRVHIFGTVHALYGFDNLRLSPFYSRSNSFLKLHSMDRVLPCEGTQEVQVEYIIKHRELEKEAKQIDLHYLVTSKGSIQDSGSLEINNENSNEDLRGKTTLKLPLNAGTSSYLRALVYILLPNGEILADSAKFNILRCFNNKVSVGFSPDEVLPGSDVSLRVQAAPGSLCGLRVVDQSVVLMKPEKELTADKVYGLFPFRDFGEYDYRIQDYEDQCESLDYPPLSYFPELSPRRSFMHLWYRDDANDDVYSLFKYMHLKIITSADIKNSRNCIEEAVKSASPGGRDFGRERGNTVLPVPKEVEKVRKDFPETWIWQLLTVGNSGSSELHHRAPDTITDWNAGAICMGPSGFGLSPPASLRVFQPFFVYLTLPYSVVRGESFTLKATAFNYLKQCIMVQITMQPTQELEQIPCVDCQCNSCLCEDESKTFYWSLKASKLGEVNITVRTEAVDTKEFCQNEIIVVPKQGSTDTVIKTLLVQPGGILEEKSHSSLICIQEEKDHSKTEKIFLKIPDNILEDSERAHITVLGDLMGTAMQNLDRLLAMPYGCGEQNMVLFSPNIFILQYLEKTHQLNNEIKSKATKFLESGYQRQLTYKRNDGSYSAFGKKDPEGNTWLTAFVVKSFSKARPYIFIDESHLNHSFTWLKNNHQDNGCFRSVGRLFNNAMKGGVEDEISLSAYVTIALLEAGLSLQDPLVSDALSCLRKAAVHVTNVYTQALLLYTFTLCGDTDLSKTLMDKLDKKAVRGDGQLHWKRDTTPPSDAPYWSRAPSAEVELTGYMLLALISSPTKDLGKVSQTVNWLSKQQNPYGGYSSTQDTVVALQALSKYAECTYSDKGDMTVTVTSTSGFLEQFHVDKNNRLLLQRATLPAIPGEYTVTATGSGCVYVQTVLRYNIPPPNIDVTFILSAISLSSKKCLEGTVTPFELIINTTYIGPRVHSNMAVIEIKMLSGYIPVTSSIGQLEERKVIQRSDIQDDIVTLYLNEIGHRPQIVSFMMEQDTEVLDLKPATVKVYDYYETDEQAIAEYKHPCSIGDNSGN
ncbi:alpha-2-macroglobulin-like protein 1 [Mixophyes fleayi]|uniref:alpha-2-macroglobulin-like protein 1 n=1 Tax=Mixophyes fleayi TaxID=3061075 RepID=UPI003F4D97C6